MESTQTASMKHILNNCNQIREHLKESKKNKYDWKYEIQESLQEIETEAQSWIK